MSQHLSPIFPPTTTDSIGDTTSSAAQLTRSVDQEVVQLSGEIFGATPFVEVPLETFFPPRRVTLRDGRGAPRATLSGRVVDEEVMHLHNGLFEASADGADMIDSSADFSIDTERPTIPMPEAEELMTPEEEIAPIALPSEDSEPAAKLAAARTNDSVESKLAAFAVIGLTTFGLATTLFVRSVPAPLVHLATAVIPAAASTVVASSPAKAERAMPAAVRSQSARIAPSAKPLLREAKPSSSERAESTAPAASEGTSTAAVAPPPAKEPAAAEEAPAAAASANVFEIPSLPPTLNPKEASAAIAAAARGASACIESGEGSRSMNVSVRFSPSGAATYALIEDGSLRGTPAASCIVQRLRSAKVSPFDGPAVTVRTNITVR